MQKKPPLTKSIVSIGFGALDNEYFRRKQLKILNKLFTTYLKLKETNEK